MACRAALVAWKSSSRVRHRWPSSAAPVCRVHALAAFVSPAVGKAFSSSSFFFFSPFCQLFGVVSFTSMCGREENYVNSTRFGQALLQSVEAEHSWLTFPRLFSI